MHKIVTRDQFYSCMLIAQHTQTWHTHICTCVFRVEKGGQWKGTSHLGNIFFNKGLLPRTKMKLKLSEALNLQTAQLAGLTMSWKNKNKKLIHTVSLWLTVHLSWVGQSQQGAGGCQVGEEGIPGMGYRDHWGGDRDLWRGGRGTWTQEHLGRGRDIWGRRDPWGGMSGSRVTQTRSPEEAWSGFVLTSVFWYLWQCWLWQEASRHLLSQIPSWGKSPLWDHTCLCMAPISQLQFLLLNDSHVHGLLFII
jgi:hypothetical protein